MNLNSRMQLQNAMEQLRAGGPGSGRHKDMAVVPGITQQYKQWQKENMGKPQQTTPFADIINRKQRTDVDGEDDVDAEDDEEDHVEAGGPGSGRHPGSGTDDPALLNKFHSFMTKHNPDMGSGQGVQNYEHAANFFHHLEEGGKTVMHKFFDHMDKASGLGKGSRVDHRGNLRMKSQRV